MQYIKDRPLPSFQVFIVCRMSLRTPTFLCDAPPFNYDANTVENFFPYEESIPSWTDERQYPDFECKDDETIKYEYTSSDDLFSTKTEILPDHIHGM
uniref:AGC-kinase C-terminal domain-containing protein n=1 Tax=Ascaris lumbricoides TaxID=6252 RepID=A0A0M3IV39_ASCLU